MGFIGRAVAPAPITANDVPDVILLVGKSGTSFAEIGAGATARPINPIINPMLFLKYLMLRQF